VGQTFLSATVVQTFVSATVVQTLLSATLISPFLNVPILFSQFDQQMEGLFRRRGLPHWDVVDGVYFVTTCLAGSVPAQGLLRIDEYRAELERRVPPNGLTLDEWNYHKQKLIFARFDDIIDLESAVRHLARADVATVVEQSLRHFANERYDLLAYVVMPSHLHWVFHPREAWALTLTSSIGETAKTTRRSPRERIMKSMKGFSAYECNRLLGLSGPFWQDEAYDHVVRDDDELFRIIRYVENNPVKANLVEHPEDWPWSSACERARRKLPYGEPLVGMPADFPVN